jgi:hypothetical protein
MRLAVSQNKLNDALEVLGSLAIASGMSFLQKLNCTSAWLCVAGAVVGAPTHHTTPRRHCHPQRHVSSCFAVYSKLHFVQLGLCRVV